VSAYCHPTFFLSADKIFVWKFDTKFGTFEHKENNRIIMQRYLGVILIYFQRPGQGRLGMYEGEAELIITCFSG